jgi:NADPH:quinone reductase-like Zn-dependent oxidoreductase
VLVRVRAASVHADVWHVVTGWPYVLRLMGAGLRRPKNQVPGTDVAGVVEAVGASVTRFSPGDEVFGETMLGMQWRNGGAFAEYVAAPEDALALKPKHVGFEQAAAVPTSGFIAAANLQPGRPIAPGQRVLVNGAAGNVGAIAVQLARAQGAQVTGVDHTDKLDLVRALGADHVIDYTAVDFTRGAERYDLLFDVASNLTVAAARRVLTPTGMYVLRDGLQAAEQARGHGHPAGRPRRRHAHAGDRPDLPARRGRRGAPPPGGWKRPRPDPDRAVAPGQACSARA